MSCYMMNKIKSDGERSAKNAAWDKYVAGVAIWVILAGVPLENGIGLEPIRLEKKECKKAGSWLFNQWCDFYCAQQKVPSNFPLDFYEEWNA